MTNFERNSVPCIPNAFLTETETLSNASPLTSWNLPFTYLDKGSNGRENPGVVRQGSTYFQRILEVFVRRMLREGTINQ